MGELTITATKRTLIDNVANPTGEVVVASGTHRRDACLGRVGLFNVTAACISPPAIVSEAEPGRDCETMDAKFYSAHGRG